MKFGINSLLVEDVPRACFNFPATDSTYTYLLRGLSSQSKYNDRATAACRRS
jgi:hypothetical protein